MHDLTNQQDQNAVAAMPQRPALPAAANAGAVSIEAERAIAEARGQMQLAKMFPRNLTAAHAELMQSCKLSSMAAVAFYSLKRGDSTISGPSIRLAEEIARVFGNFEFGHRELSRGDGKSEVEVYAWDKETNNRSIRQITVRHVIDTKHGPKACRDQRDIDDLIANKASKQLRGRILAMMPKWLVEEAVEQCKKTLAGANDEPLPVRVRKMTQAFAKYGVTVEHLEKYLGKPLDDILLDELVDLIGVHNAIRDGEKPSEYFGGEKRAADDERAPDTPRAPAASGAAPAPANDNNPPPAKAHPAASRRKKDVAQDQQQDGDGQPPAPPAEATRTQPPAQADAPVAPTEPPAGGGGGGTVLF